MAAETKLGKLVAVSGDVDALVAQLKLTQAERKTAEARVSELEGIELDIRASRDRVLSPAAATCRRMEFRTVETPTWPPYPQAFGRPRQSRGVPR